MEEIEEQVVSLRGLRPTGPTARTLLPPEALRQHVLDDFLGDYSPAEAADDTIVLALFGLLEPDFDLRNLYLELYTEQIAGYYDDQTQEMVVVQGGQFGGLERLTYAHEFVHALQDQTYDFENGLAYNDERCEVDSEACAGIQALIEGDATLLEEQWLRTYATEQDYDQLRDFYGSYQSPVFDSAPAFLQKDFLFPYDTGLEFVRLLYLEDGWAGVDAAYLTLPRSTEQLLHPERYPSDPPVHLEVPDLSQALGGEWREVERNVLGEWYTRLMLEVHLSPAEAAAAAEGWEGDTYLVLTDEAQDALLWVMKWDDVRQAQDAASALAAYSDLRFGPGQVLSGSTEWQGAFGVARLERRADQTLWLLAPDALTADALRAGVLFPAPEP